MSEKQVLMWQGKDPLVDEYGPYLLAEFATAADNCLERINRAADPLAPGKLIKVAFTLSVFAHLELVDKTLKPEPLREAVEILENKVEWGDKATKHGIRQASLLVMANSVCLAIMRDYVKSYKFEPYQTRYLRVMIADRQATRDAYTKVPHKVAERITQGKLSRDINNFLDEAIRNTKGENDGKN